MYLSDHTLAKTLHGLPNGRVAPPLVAHLYPAVVLAGGRHDHVRLRHIVAAGLLHIDVLAGLHGEYGGRGVPEIRGRDGENVHLGILEDAPEVDDPLGIPRLEGLGTPSNALLIDVADVGHLDSGSLGKTPDVGDATAQADYAHAQVIARLVGSPDGTGREGKGTGKGSALDKTATGCGD